MKRLATFVLTMLVAGSLSFAQTGTGSTGAKSNTTPTAESKKNSDKGKTTDTSKRAQKKAAKKKKKK